jgi:hypothetical protein
MERAENDGACFPPFPQTLEIARGVHREMKIMRSDFHIPSAPAARMNQFQNPKGQNPASPTLRFLQAHPSIGKDWKRASGLHPGPARAAEERFFCVDDPVPGVTIEKTALNRFFADPRCSLARRLRGSRDAVDQLPQSGLAVDPAGGERPG